MKKTSILSASLLLILAAGCSEDQIQQTAVRKKATFTIGNVGTMGSRSVTHNDGTTEFVVGDGIGIFATKGAEGSNVKHTVGPDGVLTSDEGIYYIGTDATANFFAYYPYQTTFDGENVNFNVATNQDSEDLFNNSDFMTATTLNVPVTTEENVSLKFQHQLSLIQLEMVVGENGRKPDSVLINNCQTGISWNYLQGTCTTTGNTAKVKMWQQSNEGNPIFKALIPAQTIPAKSKLLSIFIGDKTYSFTTSADVTLGTNNIKKFKVGIGSDDKLVVFSTDITAGSWQEDSEVIEGEGTLVEPETIMAETNFENFNYNTVNKTKEEINAAGWWRFVVKPDEDVVEVTDDAADAERGKVMHFNRSNLAWHNGTFYYCAKNVIKGRYVLKFKAKSSVSENMKANQLRIGAYMQEFYTGEDGKLKNKDYFAIIENNKTEVTTVYKQILTSDAYDEYTIVFDLGRVSTIHNATAANVTEESKQVASEKLLKKVVLYLSPNKAGTDFWIDDISWEPLKD